MKKHYNSLENRIVDTLVLIICVCIFVICILPLINVLALSFSGKEAAIAGKVSLWPVDFTLDSYKYLLQENRFFIFLDVCEKSIFRGDYKYGSDCINGLSAFVGGKTISIQRQVYVAINFYHAI